MMMMLPMIIIIKENKKTKEILFHNLFLPNKNICLPLTELEALPLAVEELRAYTANRKKTRIKNVNDRDAHFIYDGQSKNISHDYYGLKVLLFSCRSLFEHFIRNETEKLEYFIFIWTFTTSKIWIVCPSQKWTRALWQTTHTSHSYSPINGTINHWNCE